MADKENEGNSNSDNENSGSSSSSPIDDLLRDPSCRYKVKSVEPRSVSTRRHIVLDNNKSDLKFKSKAFENLYLQTEESTMSTPPELFDGKYSFPVDSSHLTSAMSGASGGFKPPKKDNMYCRAGGHLIGVCRKRIYSEQQKARIANIVSSDPQGSSDNNRGCSNGDNPNDFGEF